MNTMFGFPKADRKEIHQFKGNFLKSVVFQVKFNPTEKILEKKNEIRSLFSEILPIINDSIQKGFGISFQSDQTPILQSIPDQHDGFELRSNDGKKIISFTKDTISYTISGPAYKNFDHLKDEIGLIDIILNQCDIPSLSRLAIRKVNIIEFRIIDNSSMSSPMDILEFIINKDLLSNASFFPSKEYIQQNIHTVTYVKEDCRLNLRYGLNLSKINTKEGQVIIDIDLFKLRNIDRYNILKEAILINEEVFNVFNWAISSEAKIHLKTI